MMKCVESFDDNIVVVCGYGDIVGVVEIDETSNNFLYRHMKKMNKMNRLKARTTKI